ncbi:MAG: ATP-binding cassette domain-containing protein [Caldilineaceae bacterium]|nr:ATP-binding cassette domain-containing protein [Caldilineaceae bacterium]
MSEQNGVLLDIQGLKKYFPVQQGFFRRTVGYIKAVDNVSFKVRAGETLGVVGESGCGKTTMGRCLVKLYEPTGGKVLLHTPQKTLSVTELEGQDRRLFRSSAQIIFQDPFASLNPRMNILETVGEPLLVNGIASGRELEERVKEVITQVGLRVEHLRRFPHSFSGGQRQRVGIARALVVRPSLVVADEPVSALDVSIQAQILNLLEDLQEQYGLTYIFVSHNMAVVRYISDRIAVMYAGKLVEIGPKQELLSHPRHPYTELLLAAVPRTVERQRGYRLITPGEPPDLANLPKGCVFQNRCKYVKERCQQEEPELRAVGDDHFASCHFAEELQLQGITLKTTTSANVALP